MLILPKFLAALCLAVPVITFAQAARPSQDEASPTATAVSSEDGPAGIVPYVKGLNLSIGTTSQHDSSNGWSSLLTPDVAYRINRNLSFDVVTPIYGYINVDVTSGTKAKPVYSLATKHFVPGDSTFNAHLEFDPDLLSYNLSASLGAPTGNKDYGLGAGQVTYAFLNHFDHSFGIFTPALELGFSDSSSLTDTRVRKSFTAVGNQAYFQAGASVELPHRINFAADAYENLPLSTAQVFSTTGRGKKKVTTVTTKGAAEDNGFETSLDIPLNPHTTLSGFYNRSLRDHIDTAGFSFTFLLKAPPQETVH